MPFTHFAEISHLNKWLEDCVWRSYKKSHWFLLFVAVITSMGREGTRIQGLMILKMRAIFESLEFSEEFPWRCLFWRWSSFSCIFSGSTFSYSFLYTCFLLYISTCYASYENPTFSDHSGVGMKECVRIKTKWRVFRENNNHPGKRWSFST